MRKSLLPYIILLLLLVQALPSKLCAQSGLGLAQSATLYETHSTEQLQARPFPAHLDLHTNKPQPLVQTTRMGSAIPAHLDLNPNDPEQPAPDGRMGNAIFWGMLIGFETVVLGGSLLSRWETGAYVVGGFYSLTALGTMAAVFDGQPELLPVTVGTTALAWYNFTYAAKHNPRRKFGTNFIGANVMAVGAVLGLILPDVIYSTTHADVSLLASPNQLGVRVGW